MGNLKTTAAALILAGAAVFFSPAQAETVSGNQPAVLTAPPPTAAGKDGASLATLRITPRETAREEGFYVMVYDHNAAAAANDGTPAPIAVFSFYPPPQAGKTVTFITAIPPETVAAARKAGALRLRVGLYAFADSAPLNRSRLEVELATQN